MKTLVIFIWIYLAMIATSFWESYIEGRNAWDKNKYGWKLKLGKFVFTGYHFYLYFIMYPLLLTLPLIINGWDKRIFGILFSAYFSGLVIEDFMWYVVNPVVKLKEFNSNFSDYHPKLKFGRIKIPLLYLLGLLISILIWYFLWK